MPTPPSTKRKKMEQKSHANIRSPSEGVEGSLRSGSRTSGLAGEGGVPFFPYWQFQQTLKSASISSPQCWHFHIKPPVLFKSSHQRNRAAWDPLTLGLGPAPLITS
jgi:hypothetical protein